MAREYLLGELEQLPQPDPGTPGLSAPGAVRRRLYVKMARRCSLVSVSSHNADANAKQDLIHELVSNPLQWQYPLGEASRDLHGLALQYADLLRFLR